jgi:hypothetical protein
VESESASCAALATACTTSPGTSTPEAQAQCYDVAECLYFYNCDGSDGLYRCFCGSNAACGSAPESGAGAPNGSCADVIRAGMGAGATNADVMARYKDPNYPAGAALNRLACSQTSLHGVCGLDDCPDPPPAIPDPFAPPCYDRHNLGD